MTDGYLIFTHHSEFGKFAQFDRVIVTGPQRSGTKIVANMISIATGFDLVRHQQMSLPGGVEAFKKSKNIVLHHPSFVAFLRDVSDERTAIVYCWRYLPDILASEHKWKWKKNYPLELGYLKKQGYIRKVSEKHKPAKLKNLIWKNTLEPTLLNTFTVKYESLDTHPLWVPKEKRDKFKDSNQVSESGDNYRIRQSTVTKKMGDKK